MTTTHTPGPWRVVQHTDQQSATVYSGSWSRPIAAVKGPSVQERDMNARLIAAAPDLMAVAMSLVNWYETKAPDVQGGPHRAYELAHDLVARIGGSK